MDKRTYKLSSNSPLDYELAKCLGLEVKKDGWTYYRSLDGVNPTLFTQPPMFTTNFNFKDYIIQKGKEYGIEIADINNIETIAVQLIDGLKKHIG